MKFRFNLRQLIWLYYEIYYKEKKNYSTYWNHMFDSTLLRIADIDATNIHMIM